MKKIEYIALVLIAGFLLMIAALYNGFPIVDEGSTAFIEQAAYPHFTPDCTPFYGIFIKVTSLGLSLWFPILAQSLITSVLLCRYIMLLLPPNEGDVTFSTVLCLLLGIVSFTGVSWSVSQLMADSFAGILLLSVLLIYCDGKATRLTLIMYVLCAFIAIAMHFSYFPVAVICALFTGVRGYVRKDRLRLVRSAWLLAACVSFWVIMCSANAVKHHGFVFARGKNVVLVAKLAENGMLRSYLDDKCGAVSLRMCDPAQKIPASQAEFLGSGESPFYRYGGWDSASGEYSRILAGVFVSPAYVTSFIRKACVSALKQMVYLVPPAAFPAYGKQSEPYKKVRSYYSDESREYVTSQQQQGLLSASVFRVAYLLIILLSTLWVWVLPRSVLPASGSLIYSVIVLFFVVNAFTIGFFSSVAPRFQYRIAWILPVTNLLILFRYYRAFEFRLILKAREE